VIERVDVVVVGAGPAGSAAAVALARASREVVLLDKAAFPRDKPCGDLIGARAMQWARRLGIEEADLAPYGRLSGVLVTADDGALDLAPATPLGRLPLRDSDARIVPRTVFDHAMVRAAQRAGVMLKQATVREVGPSGAAGRMVRVQEDGGERMLLAAGVVLAGGYGCRLAAEVAPRAAVNGSARGIAMRGYVARTAAPSDRIVFSLDRWVLPGYGWVFPLPNGGANVGVGTLAATGAGGNGREHLRDLYDRYLTDRDSPAAAWLEGAEPVGTPRSWPLDLGPQRRRLAADRLVVAGEAAGLVGPLTGAGIAFALDSGARAGDALARALAAGDASAAALMPYQVGVRRRFLPWLRAELWAQRFLSNPTRVRGLLNATRPLPPTATLGARLLLHLG
jgi:geranylgeranyl reductase family protein